MKVISILNPKGGVGKSNTSRTLARGVQLKYKHAVLVETDPQNSLQAWRRISTNKLNKIFAMPEVINFNDIDNGSKSIHIIDGLAANVSQTKMIADRSDIIIIPTQASPDDFIQLGELLALVNETNAIIYLLLTRTRKNSKLVKQAIEVFSENQLNYLGAIRESEEIKQAAEKGLTAFECRKSGIAYQDAEQMTKQIITLLKGNKS